MTEDFVLLYGTNIKQVIAPRNATEFEETFSLREKGDTFERVLKGKLFRVACFTNPDDVSEHGAATAAAGMGRNVNPYPKGDARRVAWNKGFSKFLI